MRTFQRWRTARTLEQTIKMSPSCCNCRLQKRSTRSTSIMPLAWTSSFSISTAARETLVQVEPIEETLEELAEKAKTGCPSSYEKIVLTLQDRIYSYVLQLLQNEEDAEDVAQDTFVKVYRHLKSFDGRARFTTWVYSIAKNT